MQCRAPAVVVVEAPVEAVALLVEVAVAVPAVTAVAEKTAVVVETVLPNKLWLTVSHAQSF